MLNEFDNNIQKVVLKSKHFVIEIVVRRYFPNGFIMSANCHSFPFRSCAFSLGGSPASEFGRFVCGLVHSSRKKNATENRATRVYGAIGSISCWLGWWRVHRLLMEKSKFFPRHCHRPWSVEENARPLSA